MADKTINDLSNSTPLSGSETLPVWQGGVTKKVTAQQIADLASGGGGAVDSVNGQSGVVVLNAADVGAASAAQGTLADTAVQPGDLSTVATSGDYADLIGAPSLAEVAISGDYTDLSNRPTLGISSPTTLQNSLQQPKVH